MTLHFFARPAAALLLAGACLHALAATPAGDDFYDHVNADWDAATEIPAGAASWGVRAQVRGDSLQTMATLYANAARNGTSAATRKAGRYYAAQMDRDAIERKGLAPLQPVLARIAALRGGRGLSRYLGAQLRNDAEPVNFGVTSSLNLFGLWVGPGLQDPTHHLPYLLQGGLSLPGPESYAASEPPALDEYRRYVAAQLTRAGLADGDARAARVVALETRIAAAHASSETSADLSRAGTLWRRADFRAKAPGMDWHAWFAAAGLPARQPVDVWQPDAVKGIAALVASVPLEDWRDYLRFHAIDAHARFLPRAISDAYFAFYDPIYIGPGQHRPYLDHVVTQTNTDMPAAGKLFADKAFPPLAKQRAGAIAAHVVAAFRRHIGQQTWMTPDAQAAARAKLDAMAISVGHPDQWPSSTGLVVRADDAFGNVDRVQAFNYRQALAKIGRRVNRGEWIAGAELFGINVMPLQNAMTIPMTELQPPFFDPDGAEAANYGAIGVRIARFVALSLDRDGSRFDASGRLHNWLSKEELALRKKSAQALAAQYASYLPLPGVALDGERTFDNNLTDLTALQVAYDALRLSREAKGEAQDVAGDREFFRAYARSMRSKHTEQGLRAQAAGSPVAPARYRVATVRNLAAWHTAFNVQPGQVWYLAPGQRVMPK